MSEVIIPFRYPDPVEYRGIPGMPHYRAGSDGTIWTCKVVGSRPLKLGEWKIKAPHLNKNNGYLTVSFSDSGKDRTMYVHYLILITFVGPRPKRSICRHFPDRSKTNNSVTNLSWGTYEQNSEDRDYHGTMLRGEKHATSRMTYDIADEIRKEYEQTSLSFERIGKKFGVGKETVSMIVRNKRWVRPCRITEETEDQPWLD